MNWYRKVRNLAVDKTVKTAIGASALTLLLSAIPEFVFALATLPRERGGGEMGLLLFPPQVLILTLLIILRSLKMAVTDDLILRFLSPLVLLMSPVLACLFVYHTPAEERGWLGVVEKKSG